ncbi:MAG: tetratricopeptide repeat protein [Phycisphaerales bacterium]|nr:tetratricopeptide repeat protein [Phycisphaerales bacterium]
MKDLFLKRILEAQRLRDEGKLREARAAAETALKGTSGHPEGDKLLSDIVMRLGDIREAERLARRAVLLAPNDASVLIHLGVVLARRDQREESERLFRRALAVQPKNVTGRGELADLLRASGRLAEAEAMCRELQADAPAVFNRSVRHAEVLAAVLLATGRGRESLEVFRLAAEAQDGNPMMFEGRAFNSLLLWDSTPEEILACHRDWARAVEPRVPLLPGVPAPGPRAAGRKLRVGLVSPDFRRHSVAYFIEPVIEHLDRSRFELFVHHTNTVTDAVTARMRACPGVSWREARPGTAAEFAQRLKRDRLDVLVDLTGLTHGHAMFALLARPAPVLVTYCGYPSTVGSSRIDFRIVDAETDPQAPADFQSHAAERLLRIDGCFLCYRPPLDEAPEVDPGPASRGEPPVFVSFNAAQKISDELLAIWGRVLSAAGPAARLLLKNAAFARADERDRFAARAARAGIDPARLELAGPTQGLREHLAAYARADVALDTFPYHGTTTTCEAMLMGVPTVTLAGGRHASRVGVSLLRAAGMPELIAGDEAGYIRLAAELALDRPRLAELRRSLRPRMLASPLCDGPGFARRFGDALERAWALAGERAAAGR